MSNFFQCRKGADSQSIYEILTLARFKQISLNEEIFINRNRKWIEDLDKLPYPAWDLFPIKKYILPFINKRYLMVETSRGCPFACDFCVTPLCHGLGFREKQPGNVVNEIEYLKTRFGVSLGADEVVKVRDSVQSDSTKSFFALTLQ